MRREVSIFRFAQRPRLGIEVNRHAVRAVLVRGTRVVRAASVALSSDTTQRNALLEAITAACAGVRSKPRVFAAIGPASSQVRRLVGLPSINDPRRLRELLRNNPRRFFLKNGTMIVTSGVQLERLGEGWATALDEPPLSELADVCRSRRLRLELAVPSVVALRRGLLGEVLVAEDGDVVATAHVDSAGNLRDVAHRRRPFSGAPAHDGIPVHALATLGDAATEYAAAYGATTVQRTEPLAINFGERAESVLPVPRWRFVVAAVSLFAAASFAFLAPPLYAMHAASRATARLAEINGRFRSARWTEQELARTTAALRELRYESEQRRSITGVLVDLTKVIPNDAWLVSLHVDSTGGTFVALAPHAASLLAALTEARSIESPTIVGSVAADQMAADRVERATIRFRWRDQSRVNARTTVATGLPR